MLSMNNLYCNRNPVKANDDVLKFSFSLSYQRNMSVCFDFDKLHSEEVHLKWFLPYYGYKTSAW